MRIRLLPTLHALWIVAALVAVAPLEFAFGALSPAECVAKFASEAEQAEIRLEEAALLETELLEFVGRAPETIAIRAIAQELGISRVWAFGGSATALAMAWRQTELGNPGYADGQFRYVDALQSAQDFDVVIDGTPEQAELFQKALETQIPTYRGRDKTSKDPKQIWEVRLLRETWNYRAALVGNADFVQMNSDSLSTGLLELTLPEAGSHGILDIRSWGSADWVLHPPLFFVDVLRGILTFYESPTHAKTQRAASGRNPEILSVIRALTKVFRYGVALSGSHLQSLARIVESTDPDVAFKNDYVKKWMAWGPKKIFLGAANVELAADVLEEIGLRRMLQKVGDPEKVDSSAWWLSRHPLRTFPLGTIVPSGKKQIDPRSRFAKLEAGRTARELNLDRVWKRLGAEQFSDYELLVAGLRDGRSSLPNAFMDEIERVHGYATNLAAPEKSELGITVEFVVHPDAVNGIDFFRVNDQVFFLNRAALSVVPQSLDWDVLDYLRVLAKHGAPELKEPAYLVRLNRNIEQQSARLSPETRASVLDLFNRRVAKSVASKKCPLQEFLYRSLRIVGPDLGAAGIANLLASPCASESVLFALVTQVLPRTRWESEEAAVQTVRQLIQYDGVKRGASLRQIARSVLSQEFWQESPQRLEQGAQLALELATLGDPRADRAIVKHLLGNPAWFAMALRQGDAGILGQLLQHKDPQALERLAAVLASADSASQAESGQWLERLFTVQATAPIVAAVLAAPDFNQRSDAERLLSRLWKLTDSEGRNQFPFFLKTRLRVSGWLKKDEI